MRKISYIIVTSVLLLSIFGVAKNAWADTHYVCNNISTCNSNGGSGWSGTPGTLSGCGSKTNPCNSLKLGYASMSSGDTLIIGNGTYTGTANMTSQGYQAPVQNQYPPSGTYDGTAGSFTTVKADVDFQVTIDGGGTNNMFVLNVENLNALKFQGIKWLRDGQGIYASGGSNSGAYSDSLAQHYWFFKNVIVGVEGLSSQGAFYPAFQDHLLLEDVAVFGNARYGIAPYQCNNWVLRRAVIRMDASSGAAGGSTGWPIAAVQNYDVQNSEIQNVIVIDSDSRYFTTYSESDGAFNVRNPLTRGSINNNFRGCIALNYYNAGSSPTTGWTSGTAITGGGDSAAYTNMILWGLTTTDQNAIRLVNINAPFDHITLGAVTGSGFGGYGTATPITNSIFANISGTAVSGSDVSYNTYYGNGSNGTTGTNAITNINPLTNHLKYLPRIENYTGLDGNDGSKRGASVIYKYGADGTFHGQAGYNTLTSNLLWPWPNEDAIKTAFASYSYSGGPVGARGFATGTSIDGSPQALTKYIWEYLGNQIPADIYGGSTPTVIYGDVSGEGSVSAYDASLAAQYAVSLITLTPAQITAADVSGDGTVSAYDASLIAQKAVGVITKFPVEG